MTVSTVNDTSGNTSTYGTGSSAADLSEQFMKLLVAQMQNQDPTNPMDNNQLTSQLAQFNTAAGVEKLNASVGNVQALMAQLGSMSAASWVGRGVLIEGDPKVAFGDATQPLDGEEKPSDSFSFLLSGDAETVTVTLTDDEGNAYTAQLKDVKSGVKTYTLDDLENFQPEPGPPQDREYTLSFEAKNPEGDNPEISGLIQEQVSGVTMTAYGAVLHLLNHDSITMGEVVVIQK
ncbi:MULTISPECIES: flagellar hook assembly protein FlgD [unclassified Enterobacter cloacae complex]|uniref:flagellar hook assembly protein FlgD n=1 Tax=unclassified Enterobacter cloacae complex TaxID=2757714 RepID=UPI001868149E|nr:MULTISPECIES: flagellar hook capping FlgD N-terminal domain-containing protein [unclassified Enterobacter cloacae complex]MBE3488004.1 flagellar biosynthesis protein FlgD [Enterobacter cloacae complex sp. P8BA]MBE4824685.1 flagellar biosynthesis protein FlgD [Enterobacter cloacae complex sp. S1]MBE4900152.1 flagellar biosynthesis protein FlgD [Enterobacter cloacae complex sp. P8RS]